jgi:hypothetical protein
MNIRQVEPRPEAKQGLPEGDRLFHFFVQSSDGKTDYLTAVHQVNGGSTRTACTCMNAVLNLIHTPKGPCCKHASEAMKIVKWELQARD